MNCGARIVTGVDRLKELVEERNEISLTQAANALQVDQSIVESWSEILEDGGLIVVQDNLRSKTLMSRHWDEHKPLASTVVSRVKNFWSQPKPFNEIELRKMHKELRIREEKQKKCAKLFEKKVKELASAEKLMCKAEQKMAEYNQKHQHLTQWERELLQLQEKVLGLQAEQDAREREFENEHKLIAQARIGLKKEKQALDTQQQVLLERNKDIEQKEFELHQVAQRVHEILPRKV